MMEIHSYRAVFDLERRIYRVDRLRLNPGGVPVRGVVYALALIAVALACGSVPPLRLAARALPWYLADLALPVGAAALLTVIAIDGRPAHLAAQALLRHRLCARRLVGLRAARAGSSVAHGARWSPSEILILPDGSDMRMRRLRYRGPGAVAVRVAHERIELGPRPLARRRLQLRELTDVRAPDRGQVIALAEGATLRAG
jgi:hypothetical protein